MTLPKIVQQEFDDEEPSFPAPWIPKGWTEEEMARFSDAGNASALKASETLAQNVYKQEYTEVKVADVMNPAIPLWDSIMLEAQRQVLVDSEKHIPLFACSVADHILNLHAMASCGVVQFGDPPQIQSNPRCVMKGRKPCLTSVDGAKAADLRLFLMVLGSPGSGKSELEKFFVDRSGGVLPQSVVPSQFFQTISRASLFGSVREDSRHPKVPIMNWGLAYKHCSGILACEEFNFFKASAGAQYNVGMEDSLLAFAEHGIVEVDFRAGSFNYTVGTTGWFGNQVDRLWLGSGESGLTRRLCMDFIFMTDELNARYKEARKVRRRIPPNSQVREYFAKRFKPLIANLHIERIEPDPDYYTLLKEFDLSSQTSFGGSMAYEEPIFDRIAAGYNLLKYWDPSQTVLRIRVDDTLKQIIRRQMHIREFFLANGSPVASELILRLQRAEHSCRKEALLREMRRLGGYSPWKVEKELAGMVKSGRIRMVGNTYDPVVELNE